MKIAALALLCLVGFSFGCAGEPSAKTGSPAAAANDRQATVEDPVKKVRALDAVGYDGKRVEDQVRGTLDAAEAHDREIESLLPGGKK